MAKYKIIVMVLILLLVIVQLTGSNCKGQTKLTVIGSMPTSETYDIPVVSSNSNYQRIVDAISAIQPTGNYTYYIYCDEAEEKFDLNRCRRGEGSFDINNYFTVLPNISMEDGYVLDYVFYDYYWGQNPVIYVRNENQEPFKNYVEFASAKVDDLASQNQYDLVKLLKDKENRVNENKIKIDGTNEGFFEYVVLQVLGGQFYLSWHSEYNDARIICDQCRIDEIVNDIEDRNLNEIPVDILEKARDLDFEPIIDFHENTVNVTVIIFTKWGGFEKLIYTIARYYPHTIVNVQRETILWYSCGVTF